MPATQCPICASTDCQPVAPYRGHSVLFQERYLVRCCDCELVFAHPVPADDELAEYNSSYFTSAHGGLPTDSKARAFHSGIARLRLRHIQDFLGARGLVATSVLEIGPGIGYLCAHFKAKWPEIDYAVVEPDRDCHTHLHGIGARVFERFEQLDANHGRFDLLVLSHVLEHTSHPVTFLQPALRLLKPGGVLFIEVPCRDHEFKSNLEPHLLFFDKPSMLRLLTRLNLTDLQLTYHGQEIERLKAERSLPARVLRRCRHVLARLGLHSRSVPWIDGIEDPAERAAIAPYEPHLIKEQPAWWLRAMARTAPH